MNEYSAGMNALKRLMMESFMTNHQSITKMMYKRWTP